MPPSARGLAALLTELVSWQSIFIVGVPLALAAGVPLLAVAREEGAPGTVEREVGRAGRPHLAANIALALVSAAIAAALFLVVLLLIEGWRLTPIAAAVVVTAMPLAALAGTRIAPLVPSPRARAAAGAILVAGGLAGLGWLPEATVVLTLPPQVLVGVGLALVLSALPSRLWRAARRRRSTAAGRSPHATPA